MGAELTRSMATESAARPRATTPAVSRRIRAAGCWPPAAALPGRIVVTFGAGSRSGGGRAGRDSWVQAGLAECWAVATTQVAFLGHDAGHRQMFRRRGPANWSASRRNLGCRAATAGGSTSTTAPRQPQPRRRRSGRGGGALVWRTSGHPDPWSGSPGGPRQAWFFFPMLRWRASTCTWPAFGRSSTGNRAATSAHRCATAPSRRCCWRCTPGRTRPCCW